MPGYDQRQRRNALSTPTSPSQAGSDARPSFRATILSLPRYAKQTFMVVTDVVLLAAALTISIWIVYGSITSVHLRWLASTVAVGVPILWASGLYTSIIRYVGFELFRMGMQAAVVITLVMSGINYFTGSIDAARRVSVIFLALALILVIGSRYLARVLLVTRTADKEPVIVYGAGDAGAQLIGNLLAGDSYLPVAVVDDNPGLRGARIKGLYVRSPSQLAELVDSTGATRVLLAIPSASHRQRREVLQRISEFPVRVQTMPGINDIVSGRSRVDDLSDVDVQDLLGRDPVPPIKRLLDASIAGKSVMVTGAGGSIGSELCRQIIQLRPKRLVCLEQAEASLYEIDRELSQLATDSNVATEVVPLLGSVHHEGRMRRALELFGVQTVYHAAAYKHVPIVERNLFEGIHNNVFGTLHTARAAAGAGVETFVLISTDKAVNPTSVMGATKRMSEMILQSIDRRTADMNVSIVRFGNVLESSGSVVPLFKEQIRSGGPVTVTHRDIIRYFMTIPEAAQLVIQAGAMARGGNVFVLDMGRPVRIEDLARRMINLMGLTVRDEGNPDGDIAIEYIGLRPAEKLYEELLIGSDVSGTEHPRIMRADEECLPSGALTEILKQLLDASSELDYERARELLMNGVREYQPANGIDDYLWGQKMVVVEDDKIIDFPQ